MLELAGNPAASKARYDVPTLPLHPPPASHLPPV